MKAVKLPKFSLLSAPRVRLPKQVSVLKTFFLTRAIREKILLLSFILIVAATWFFSVVGRTNRFARNFKVTSTELAVQRGWLNEQERIDAAAKAAVEHLDPAKTFDGVRLQGELVSIATRLGMKDSKAFSADNAVSERASVFTKHSMQVTIRNVDYATLVKFYLEVVKQTPYIGFDQVRVTSTANQQHSATMRVTSVELVK